MLVTIDETLQSVSERQVACYDLVIFISLGIFSQCTVGYVWHLYRPNHYGDKTTLTHLLSVSVVVSRQVTSSPVAQDRDPHWEELQQAEEHAERPQPAHSKCHVCQCCQVVLKRSNLVNLQKTWVKQSVSVSSGVWGGQVSKHWGMLGRRRVRHRHSHHHGQSPDTLWLFMCSWQL